MQLIELSQEKLEGAYAEWETGTRIYTVDAFEAGVRATIAGVYKGTPFAFDSRLAFRSGEVTVWAAQNGHGKSLLTGQIAMQLALAGENVCVFSFEMLPRWTVYRMMRQWCRGEPTEDDIYDFFDAFRDKLYLLDHQGNITQEQVLGACVVARRRYSCKHVFIDNLMKVVSAETGDKAMAEQKSFIQRLGDLARGLDIHIHVVHHVRKPGPDMEGRPLSKYDLKGSGSISDQADNVVLLQRNLKKEETRQNRGLSYEADEAEGDVMLRVAKQRNGDWEGIMPLWFDQSSKAFCLGASRVPLFPGRDR